MKKERVMGREIWHELLFNASPQALRETISGPEKTAQ
jgi:hypothetical protein